jgi:hypothetical protein
MIKKKYCLSSLAQVDNGTVDDTERRKFEQVENCQHGFGHSATLRPERLYLYGNHQT